MGPRPRASRAWCKRAAVFAIVVGAAGWFAGSTVAGVSSKHVAAKVKAHGLTGAERRAIQIVSVLAAGDDSSGLVVTVKFKGGVQDRLGQGDLKHGLVALILEPKRRGQAPTGLVDQGGGSFRFHGFVPVKAKHATAAAVRKVKLRSVVLRVSAPEVVLSNTSSREFGAVRIRNLLVFFVGGVKLSSLRAVEVKAFATPPTHRGHLASAAADPAIPGWRDILKKKPSDFGQLGIDPSKLTCDQLKALRKELSDAVDFDEIDLHRVQSNLDVVNQYVNSFSGFGASLPGSLQSWLALRDGLRDAIKGLEAEIANLNKLIDQIDKLLEKCAPSTSTAMGSLSNGSGSALAYSAQTNTTANAFELILPTGISITGTSTPPGFSCSNNGNKEVCTGGSVQPNTPVTGTFNHTGTISANCGCVQVAFSQDGGMTWSPNPPAALSGPPSDSAPRAAGCSGHALLGNIYSGQAHQVTADFTCPKASTEFSLTVPSGYQITGGQATNSASSGYTCSLNSTMNTVDCIGNAPAGSTTYVQFTTSPNPQAGMNLALKVSFSDGSTTSFTLTTQ